MNVKNKIPFTFCLLFTNAFYELFSRWMRDINPDVQGKWRARLANGLNAFQNATCEFTLLKTCLKQFSPKDSLAHILTFSSEVFRQVQLSSPTMPL